jgi:hypothetical protein
MAKSKSRAPPAGNDKTALSGIDLSPKSSAKNGQSSSPRRRMGTKPSQFGDRNDLQSRTDSADLTYILFTEKGRSP